MRSIRSLAPPCDAIDQELGGRHVAVLRGGRQHRLEHSLDAPAASVSKRARAALVSVTVSSFGRPRPRCGTAMSASAVGASVMCEPI